MRLHLPAKVRPKESDIGVIALLIAESPTLSGWVVERGEVLDFGKMKT